MQDIQTIKNNYQSMSVSQLQQLARNEMDDLTPEAKVILKEELNRRNINMELDSINEMVNEPQINFSKVEKHIIQYIIEQKEKRESDAFITGGLIERGMDEDFINLLLTQFDRYLNERKNKMSNLILTGTLQLVSGIAIIELPLNKQNHLAIFIIAYSLIILGTFRILHGYFNKKKIFKITTPL